jgi:uncharacterized membrane protein SpoIIM required for sporulation
MFVGGAPVLGFFVWLILWKLVSISENRKIKKLEEEMRAKGMNENTIFFFTRTMKF